MNDPIKDFIEKNRGEFDHLEAPAFDLNKFKAGLHQAEPKQVKTVFMTGPMKWLVAASVSIALLTFLYFNRETKQDTPAQLATIGTNQPTVRESDEAPAAAAIGTSVTGKQAIVPVLRNRRVIAKHKSHTNAAALYAQLLDSSSASNRLSAILKIDSTGLVSNDLFNKLASTLNYDGNSNVRLAALGIMQKYSKDAYVSSLLVSSLHTQLDPMVQLDLVTILGKIDNLKIEDKLYALASDPNTFDAVKDEAYQILLNQNKL